jgi:hypothetical protein
MTFKTASTSTSSTFASQSNPSFRASVSIGRTSDEGEGSDDDDQIETLAERMARLEVDASAQFASVHPVRESSGGHFAGKVQKIKNDIEQHVREVESSAPVQILDPVRISTWGLTLFPLVDFER